MKFALVLSVFAIAAVQSVQSATVDIDWIYGMTENEVCVAPGNKISFHFKFKRFSNQREILDGKCFSCTAALETEGLVSLSVCWLVTHLWRRQSTQTQFMCVTMFHFRQIENTDILYLPFKTMLKCAVQLMFMLALFQFFYQVTLLTSSGRPTTMWCLCRLRTTSPASPPTRSLWTDLSPGRRRRRRGWSTSSAVWGHTAPTATRSSPSPSPTAARGPVTRSTFVVVCCTLHPASLYYVWDKQILTS